MRKEDFVKLVTEKLGWVFQKLGPLVDPNTKMSALTAVNFIKTHKQLTNTTPMVSAGGILFFLNGTGPFFVSHLRKIISDNGEGGGKIIRRISTYSDKLKNIEEFDVFKNQPEPHRTNHLVSGQLLV